MKDFTKSKELTTTGIQYGKSLEAKDDAEVTYSKINISLQKKYEHIHVFCPPGYWTAILLDNEDREILVDSVIKDCQELRIARKQMYEKDKVCIREMIMEYKGSLDINHWHLARFVLEEKFPEGKGAIYRLRGDCERMLR